MSPITIFSSPFGDASPAQSVTQQAVSAARGVGGGSTRIQLTEVVLQGTPDLLKGADSASVQVNERGGATAVLYRDDTSASTWANPLITRDGHIEPVEQPGGVVWLLPGSYDLIVSLGGQSYTTTFEAVVGGDAANVSDLRDSSYWDRGTTQDYGTTATEGQLFEITVGTDASPDRAANPVFKVSRTYGHQVADTVTGDANDQLSALYVVAEGTPAMERQPVAINGLAIQAGTIDSGYADAIGIKGTARLKPGAVGDALAAMFGARKDAGADPGAQIVACSLHVQNYTGIDDPYIPNGPGKSNGITVLSTGDSLAERGISFYRSSGKPQVDVGLGFSSPNSGLCKSADIRTDDTSVIVIDIRGSHDVGLDLQAATFASAAIHLGPAHDIWLDAVTGTKIGTAATQKIGFWNKAPVARPAAIAGSRGGNAALADLLTKLASTGLIVDSTTA